MLDIRFHSLLIKNGHNPNVVLSDITIFLKSTGIRNTTAVLPLIVNILVLPLEIKKRRRGRNFLNVPFPISKDRQESIVLHNLIKVAKQSKNSMKIGECLGFHIIKTLRGDSILISNRNDAVRTLKYSRPFAFMRWYLYSF